MPARPYLGERENAMHGLPSKHVLRRHGDEVCGVHTRELLQRRVVAPRPRSLPSRQVQQSWSVNLGMHRPYRTRLVGWDWGEMGKAGRKTVLRWVLRQRRLEQLRLHGKVRGRVLLRARLNFKPRHDG